MNAILNTPQPMAPTDTAAPLLEIAHLRKHFGSGPHPVRAVDDVSFTIRRGETLGLVGESGSGKSTIGRLLTRLVDPTSGQMRYHGGAAPQDLAQLSQSQYRPLRSQIQIIFQDPYASLNPRMRIRDVLAEALDTHGLAKGAARLLRAVNSDGKGRVEIDGDTFAQLAEDDPEALWTMIRDARRV